MSCRWVKASLSVANTCKVVSRSPSSSSLLPSESGGDGGRLDAGMNTELACNVGGLAILRDDRGTPNGFDLQRALFDKMTRTKRLWTLPITLMICTWGRA